MAASRHVASKILASMCKTESIDGWGLIDRWVAPKSLDGNPIQALSKNDSVPSFSKPRSWRPEVAPAERRLALRAKRNPG